MLNIIFPALKQNSDTIDKHIHIIYKFAFWLFGLIYYPIITWYNIIHTMEVEFFSDIFVFILLILLAITDLLFPAIICKLLDMLFFKKSFMFVQYLRALLPLTVIWICLKIVATTCPVLYITNILLVFLNLWMIINLFISLRKVFGYSMKQAVVPVALFAVIIFWQ